MNKRLIPIIILAIAVVLFIYNRPLDLVNHKEISRGYELIKGIEAYQQKKGKLPENGDWAAFQEIGFTIIELEHAYPEFRKLSDTSYELSYTEGFDPPYLIWNSTEREWKEGFPSLADFQHP
ncbi:MAG: hypothetical protein EP332_00020 [Bacteroidetes bacterium]|nr:MAG: hypothetical protein EP332_00020 [Bacteroidota bacterium]